MMTGLIRIYLSDKEPDKHHLWLKPRKNDDGYDLLYFGYDKWKPLIKCHCNEDDSDITQNDPPTNNDGNVYRYKHCEKQ